MFKQFIFYQIKFEVIDDLSFKPNNKEYLKFALWFPQKSLVSARNCIPVSESMIFVFSDEIDKTYGFLD